MIQYVEFLSDVNIAIADDLGRPKVFHLRFENLAQIIEAQVLSVSKETEFKTSVTVKLRPGYAGMHIPISFLQKDSVCTLLDNYPFVEAGKGIIVRAWFEPALRALWKNTPIPEADKIVFPYTRTFTFKEYERIKLGVIPMAMEDKWFVYFENDRLYCHRSWTGIGVFEVEIKPTSSGAVITNVIANNDSAVIKWDPVFTNVLEAYLLNNLCTEAERIFDV